MSEKHNSKEKRPPIDTGGKGFNEVLKRMSQTKLSEVRDLEKKNKQGK